MSLRTSLSGLKKKLKRRLKGSRYEPEGAGAETSGERVDWVGRLAQPEPNVIAEGGHDRPRPGNEASMDEGRVDSMDPPPDTGGSGVVPASESGDDMGREAPVERKEASKKDLYLGPDVEGVVESGSSQEESNVGGEKIDVVYPPPSAPLISHGQEPESMQTTRYFSRYL